MSKRITSMLSLISIVVLGIAAPLTSAAETGGSEKKMFSQSVRIGYVPHSAFLVDNGVASGALARLMECSITYFQKIEYVEMPTYERMMMSLETNIIDIGLNMVRTQKRDKLANYAMDLYNSRILMVTNKENASDKRESLGVIGVVKGTEMANLLAVKGLEADLEVKSIDQLFNMYRNGYIDSFAEAEISVIGQLHALDVLGIDYDYSVMSEHSGGAYVSFDFAQKNPEVLPVWKTNARACAYLAPQVDE